MKIASTNKKTPQIAGAALIDRLKPITEEIASVRAEIAKRTDELANMDHERAKLLHMAHPDDPAIQPTLTTIAQKKEILPIHITRQKDRLAALLAEEAPICREMVAQMRDRIEAFQKQIAARMVPALEPFFDDSQALQDAVNWIVPLSVAGRQIAPFLDEVKSFFSWMIPSAELLKWSERLDRIIERHTTPAGQ